MQVSVEAGEGLERKLTVQIPAETVEMEVSNRLNSLKNTVRIDGFRPGKVPMRVIRQQYSSRVLHDVAGELMQSTFQQAMTQENLQPAGEPVISAKEINLGQEMEYTATFEIYPVVELAPVADISIEKQTAIVEESDVDTMIETLRKQRMNWDVVDRVSEDGDRVTVDFNGTVDGQVFEGGNGNDMPVVLGSNNMIPGFEGNLKGLSVADKTTFTVPFPDDYAAKDLAGKNAEFNITVKKVEAPELPEVNEDFAKTFGVEDGSVEALRKEIRGNMERELDKTLRADTKNRVMDALLISNPVDVPLAIVQKEAETLKQQSEADQPGAGQSVDNYMGDAKRRVRLGILLAEVAKIAALQIDPSKVQERVAEMARDYEDPDEFTRYYASNPQLLRGVETLVMEDMVVDWIVEQVQVNEKATSFDTLMNPVSS